MLIYEKNLHRRNQTSILAEKIAFPPKPDEQTDRHTDGRTDRRMEIIIYTVASLLKMWFIIVQVRIDLYVIYYLMNTELFIVFYLK